MDDGKNNGQSTADPNKFVPAPTFELKTNAAMNWNIDLQPELINSLRERLKAEEL